MVKVGVAYRILERRHTEDTGKEGRRGSCGGSKIGYMDWGTSISVRRGDRLGIVSAGRSNRDKVILV